MLSRNAAAAAGDADDYDGFYIVLFSTLEQTQCTFCHRGFSVGNMVLNSHRTHTRLIRDVEILNE